jgi:hypothetical protein
LSILNALGPVFILVLLGAALRRLKFPGDGFWPLAERFTYYLLFPALLISKLATASFENVAGLGIALTVVVPLIVITVALLLLSGSVSRSGKDFTSIYQGSIRFNSYVGLAAVSQLYGDPGMTIAAVTMAILIPIINVFCVIIFVIKTGAGDGALKTTAVEIATNPLIIGCLLGVALNLTGIGLPFWSDSVFHLLSLPALPLGLLAVGAGLRLDTLHSEARALIFSSSVKFVVLPLTALGMGMLVGLEGMSLQVVVLFFCMPTASSAYILARELGGNAPLMATLITGQTLLAMVTLPIVTQLITRL